ncbi:MAG: HlyC/CorC family transporter [Bryobacteraceae bacterium]|nr:HlyC/CorC family transporter [Bryobacteraceae bacterium]
MSILLGIVAAVLPLGIALASLVQLLYIEGLRLRTRGLPAYDYFKETLQGKLGFDVEDGALIFSLVKQTLLVVEAAAILGALEAGQALTWGAFAEAAFLSASVMIGAVYVAPQALYHKTDGRWLSLLVPLLKVMALPARPVVWLFRLMESLAGLGEAPRAEPANGNSTQEIEALIDAGAGEGLIEESDRRMLQSVMALSSKSVGEVMTPRGDVVAIPHDASLEQLRVLAGEQGYSRIPVYQDSIDNILGFVHVRDILKYANDESAARPVSEFMRPIRSAPESKPVHDLFREMQQDGAHMAVVVDEYGNTAGLVTMEDVVEEVFGEIQDEHDQPGDVRQEAEGVWILSGNVDLDLLNELVGFRPPHETESTTVGGLVTEWLGHVPLAGETAEKDGIRIEVTAADERRVEEVRISKAQPPVPVEVRPENGR